MKNVKEIVPQYNEVQKKWRVKYRHNGVGRLSGWKYLQLPHISVKTFEHETGVFYDGVHYKIATFDSREEAEQAIIRWIAPPTEYHEMEEGEWEDVAVYHPRKRAE